MFRTIKHNKNLFRLINEASAVFWNDIIRVNGIFKANYKMTHNRKTLDKINNIIKLANYCLPAKYRLEYNETATNLNCQNDNTNLADYYKQTSQLLDTIEELASTYLRNYKTEFVNVYNH